MHEIARAVFAVVVVLGMGSLAEAGRQAGRRKREPTHVIKFNSGGLMTAFHAIELYKEAERQKQPKVMEFHEIDMQASQEVIKQESEKLEQAISLLKENIGKKVVIVKRVRSGWNAREGVLQKIIPPGKDGNGYSVKFKGTGPFASLSHDDFTQLEEIRIW